MNYKIIVAAAVVLMMVALPFAVMDDGSDAASGTNAVGSVNVYYADAEGVDYVTVQAFDLYQALVAAEDDLGLTINFEPGADSWNQDEGGYYNPNENYGAIGSIQLSDGGYIAYDVFVYNPIEVRWNYAEDAIGWYRPFADYANTVTFNSGVCAGSANIAIVRGDYDLTTITNLQPLTEISESSTFRYSFYLKDDSGTVNVPDNTTVTVRTISYTTITLTNAMLQSGIVIYGYGSDAYLALMDAVGVNQNNASNLIGQTATFVLNGTGDSQYYTYYSWMDTLFGSGTETTYNDDGSTTYLYWSSYTAETGYYLDYTLGYYSSLTGAYNSGADFSIVYESMTY